MKKSHSIDMCSGSLADKILLFALPLMASSLLQLLFNAADVVVVGRFAGKEALAAVGSNTSLINLMINLFIGLSVGTNVVVARDLGAGRHDKVSHSVHTAMTLALVSGIGMMVFGVAMVRQLLEWMASPTDVIDLATVYLRIYFLGMPANLVYNFGAAILRAQGDTQRPLYFLTFAGVVNVALNLLFVINLRMDVAGVALATIIAQYISAILVVRCMMREQGPLHMELKQLGLRRKVVGQILRVGLPAGFQGVVFALSNVVIQSALNSFNDPALVAGSAAGSNIESFVYTTMNAFHQAAISFVGQNYGAGQCGPAVYHLRGAVRAGAGQFGLSLRRAAGRHLRPRRARCGGAGPGAAALYRLPLLHLRHYGGAGGSAAGAGQLGDSHGYLHCGQLRAAAGVGGRHIPPLPHPRLPVSVLPRHLECYRPVSSAVPDAGGPAQGLRQGEGRRARLPGH